VSNFLIDLIVSRFQKAANGGQQPARATQYGSQAVAQVEPSLLELTRAGVRFGGGLSIIANAVAPVQAIPTTTAGILIYNADDVKSLVIDHATMFLASGTSDIGALLMAAVTGRILETNAPAAMTTGWAVGSLSGSAKTSPVKIGAAVTIPAGAVWMALAGNAQPVATTAGASGNPAQLNGGLIVPPRCGLALAVLSGAGTTAKYGMSFSWSELELDRE